jgi:hypothetical protein
MTSRKACVNAAGGCKARRGLSGDVYLTNIVLAVMRVCDGSLAQLCHKGRMPETRPHKHYKAAMQRDGSYTIIVEQDTDQPSASFPGFATLDAALDEIARLEAIDRGNALLGRM